MKKKRVPIWMCVSTGIAKYGGSEREREVSEPSKIRINAVTLELNCRLSTLRMILLRTSLLALERNTEMVRASVRACACILALRMRTGG